MKIALVPVASVGSAMVAFILIMTGRDALFLSERGLHELSLGFVAIAAASIPAAAIHVTAIRRLGMGRVRRLLLLLSGLLFVAITPILPGSGVPVQMALFVVVPVIFAAVFAALWLLAAELFEDTDPAAIRRAYSRVGAGSLVGGIVGGLLAKLLSSAVPPEYLVGCGGILLFVIAWVIAVTDGKPRSAGHRHAARADTLEDEGDSAPVSVSEGAMMSWFRLVRLPYVTGMVGLSSLAAMVGLLIEFQFYAEVKLSGNANAEFFANFYTLLNVAALILQLGVTPIVQSRLGVAGSLLVMPTGLLAGAALAGSNIGLLSASAMQVAESGLKSAVHRSMWEQAFLFLHRKIRGIAKALVDGLFARMAEGVTALSILLLLTWSGGESCIRV